MDFNKEKKGRGFGKVFGYIVMYFIFTTILYFILVFLEKIPENWNFFHVVLITISIVLLGNLIKLLLR